MTDGDAPRIFSPEYYARMRELEGSAWWNAGMRDIAQALLSMSALPRHGFLVDAGCGSGQTMSWFLSANSGWNAWGGDVATDGVRAAGESGLTVSAADVMQLPLRNELADLVISFDVLQHLPLDGGDIAALNEFYRVLKPGGLFLLRTNSQSWPKTEDDPANQFRKYDPYALALRLRQAGFEISRLSRANALLGLAEVKRELKATKESGFGYHGILANAKEKSRIGRTLKRALLGIEGAAIARGARLPFGRSIVAVCRKPLIAHLKAGITKS